MNGRITLRIALILICGPLFAETNATAQTIGYRQINLASNLPNLAHAVTSSLVNPWGIAFLPNQPFFIADKNVGRVSTHDASGSSVLPVSITIPNAAQNGFGAPIAIVADVNSSFANATFVQPFLVATEEGTVLAWGPDAQGNTPQQTTLVIDNSLQGAVYKGVTILDSSSAQPALAITNFHEGSIDTFLPGFTPVALAGSFTDPTLPANYAPFGIQMLGNQVFVTYAVQDVRRHDPVVGPGNGIVSIFDLNGNFIRRFATGGALNAPWGIVQAPANFGPFSNDILIGNVGDGIINAFDPATGRFAGQLHDGDGNIIINHGLHALTFRTDRFGNPNTLYCTIGINNEEDGLLSAITAGLLSSTTVTIPPATTDAPLTITIETSAGVGNTGTPTGQVVVQDGDVALASQPLVDGMATFETVFTSAGNHNITVRYSGDDIFLPSTAQTVLQVQGQVTTLTLTAPAAAAPHSAVTLTATITSAGGVPTGQILFLDGATGLGTAPLDDSGEAVLRTNTLAVGIHSLTVSYSGDGKFSSSRSTAITINIANPDFSLSAAPPTATVIAGESAQFMLTVTPVGGFANNVTFSCAPSLGITCAFDPATINPADATNSITLKVSTSARILHFGFQPISLIGPGPVLTVVCLLGFLAWRGRRIRIACFSMQALTTAFTVVVVGLALIGCGGSGSGTQDNRGTASIVITATSGTISHVTTLRVTVQ